MAVEVMQMKMFANYHAQLRVVWLCGGDYAEAEPDEAEEKGENSCPNISFEL